MTNRIGEVITSSTFNAIRGRVNRVLGVGDGTTQGYGLELQSQAKGDGETITAADMIALYNDIVRARIHQKGSTNLEWTNPEGLAPPSSDEIIGYYAADVNDLPDQTSNTYNLLWVDGDNGIGLYNPLLAGSDLELRIVTNGRLYEVNITDEGQGFSIGDTILIPGTLVGGSSPANDLTITAVTIGSNGNITFIDPALQTGEAKPQQSSEGATEDINEGFQDYLDAVTDIENDKDLIGPGQSSVKIVATSSRTSTWSSIIYHAFEIEWDTADNRRYFFNTGGEIRFNASLTGGLSVPGTGTAAPPSVKDEIWQSMLGNVGTVFFGKNRVYGNGTEGTGVEYGNFSGTTEVDWESTSSDNRLKVFSQTGVGIYSENEYYIDVFQKSDTILSFQIVFNDADLGDPNEDEFVTGRIDTTISLKLITGELAVPEPTIFERSEL